MFDATVRIPYFAYGSNMAEGQMEAWCIEHRAIGPARLDGFRLAFLRDSPRWLAGAADIVPSPRGEVWGVLYEVSSTDLAALDRKENSAGRLGYRRRSVSVSGGGGRSFRAITYVVVQRASREMLPSPEYLELMLEGARAHGIPQAYLDRVREHALGLPSAPWLRPQRPPTRES